MAEFGQYETTRQSAQPLEGYEFFWGNGSVAGTSASPPPATETALTDCAGAAGAAATLTEAWTGGNDSDITGRILSGGTGTWAQVVPAEPDINIVSGHAETTVTNHSETHHIVTGHGLGNDQSVRVTGQFPVLTVTDSAIFSALARHSSTTYEGYELMLEQSAALGTTVLTLWKLTVADGYTPLQVFSTALFPVNESHTIRLDVAGSKQYGYLDDVLLLVGNDAEITTGSPGLCIQNSSFPVSQNVIVTAWSAAPAVAVPLTTEQHAAHGRDGFDGANDSDIDGRNLDGDGRTCLADGTWVKPVVRGSHGAIVSDELWFTCDTDPNAVGDHWTHYVATGFPNIGNDYSVNSTWTLVEQPDDPETVWTALLARHLSTEESGYEFNCRLYGDTTVPGSGGVVFEIFRPVNGNYDAVLATVDTRGTGEVALGGHTLTFHVDGSRLCGYMDDELVIVADDDLNLYPTGGYPGICLLDGNASGGVGAGGSLIVTQWSVFSDVASEPCGSASTDALLTLNYTTADVSWTYEGKTFLPMIGARSSLNSGSGERTASEIDLRVPFDHPVSQLAMQGVPRGPIGCTVYRVDRQDLTDGSAAIPLQGQITRHRIEGRWCVITLGNVGTLLTRKLPRLLTQRSCPHVLYGPFCQVDATSFTHAGLEVTAVSGRAITVSGASAAGTDATYFSEGVLLTADGLREWIESQSGDNLLLKQTVPGLDVGDTVTLIAGCDHRATTCDTRFGNIIRYGGEIGMPDRNPTTGAGISGAGSAVENV